MTVVKAGREGDTGSNSDLLAKLGNGKRWSHVINGKIMQINVLHIDTIASPAYARVRISENGSKCDAEAKASAEF